MQKISLLLIASSIVNYFALVSGRVHMFDAKYQARFLEATGGEGRRLYDMTGGEGRRLYDMTGGESRRLSDLSSSNLIDLSHFETRRLATGGEGRRLAESTGGEDRRLFDISSRRLFDVSNFEGRRLATGGEGRRLSDMTGGEGRRLVDMTGGEGRRLVDMTGGEGRRLVGMTGGEDRRLADETWLGNKLFEKKIACEYNFECGLGSTCENGLCITNTGNSEKKTQVPSKKEVKPEAPQKFEKHMMPIFIVMTAFVSAFTVIVAKVVRRYTTTPSTDLTRDLISGA